MSTVRAVGSALPEFCADNSAVLQAATEWLRDEPDKIPLFTRFLESSRTKHRYFAIPPSEIISQDSLEQRSQRFEALAPRLAAAALDQCLRKSLVKPQDIDALIFSSCSCPLIPAPDTYLIEEFGLRRDILRIPTYQCGCAGGVFGLGVVQELSPSISTIAIVSAELCSLVFQPSNTSTSHLVGAALFGDGAAAAVVTKEPGAGLQLLAHQSYLLPNSRNLMGYDIRDTGSHLRLDRELPPALLKYIPNIVQEFLRSNHTSTDHIKWWLFHPGSSKILGYLDEMFSLGEDQAPWSKEVLARVGNLSSATILFVLEDFLTSRAPKEGDQVLILGIGPGLTIELILAAYAAS